MSDTDDAVPRSRLDAVEIELQEANAILIKVQHKRVEFLERELAALQEESRQWDKTSLVAILARAEKAERELAESVDTIYALITYPEAHGALAAKARAGFLKSRLEAAARDAEILAKAYLVAETVKQPREEK